MQITASPVKYKLHYFSKFYVFGVPLSWFHCYFNMMQIKLLRLGKYSLFYNIFMEKWSDIFMVKGSVWHLRSARPGFNSLIWFQHHNSKQKICIRKPNCGRAWWIGIQFSEALINYLWNTPGRVCVSTGAVGAQTRRSLGHPPLHPQILRPRAFFYRTDYICKSKFLKHALRPACSTKDLCNFAEESYFWGYIFCVFLGKMNRKLEFLYNVASALKSW